MAYLHGILVFGGMGEIFCILKGYIKFEILEVFLFADFVHVSLPV